MTLFEELMGLVDELGRNGIEYALVGGLAVADGKALLSVDFILVNENLEATWSSRQAHETSGRTLWVVSRDALIAMKALAARPQDIADIESLRDIDR